MRSQKLKSELTIDAVLPQNGNALSGKTVLVVDNELINQKLFGIYLAKTGANVLYAKNGAAAVKAACDGVAVDIISMDIKMPVMGGFEALRKIKAHYASKGMYIPIVATTAHALITEAEKILSAGFDAYIPLPVKKKNYLTTLASNLTNNF